jgi:hypothetical protein
MKNLVQKDSPEDDERLERYKQVVEQEESTQARKKLWSYFLEISSSDWFENKVLEIREKYGIPKKGYTSLDGTYITPPEQLSDRFNADRKIQEEIEAICDKYSLHNLDWFSEIQQYIFYNELTNIYELNAKSLLYLADLAEEKNDPFSESTQASDNKHFPIAIRISPYATERDILDFVKKTYKTSILPALESYRKSGVKIGKVKIKDDKIMERNKFIYANKDLPRKEIMRLVNKKFGVLLDYGHIGKIISIENKRRKDVST